MTPRKIRILKVTLLVLTSFLIIVILSGGILSYYARGKAEAALKSIGSKIGSLSINLFTQSISIEEFDLNFSGDSSKVVPHTVQIKNIRFKGISLYDLLIHKKLKINQFIIDDGNILFNRKLKLQQTSNAQHSFLKGIEIEHLIVKNVKAVIVTDSVTEYSGTIHLLLNSIQSSDTSSITNVKAYTVKSMDVRLKNLIINDEKGLYKTKIAQVHANTTEQKLSIDSIVLQPQHTKFKFSRVAGKQTDRINAFISNVTISGLRYNQLKDSLFLASKIEIYSSELVAFRDKRMPFKEIENKPLPMAVLKKLGFAVEVDTLKLYDAKITYEEFPSDGFKSGNVIFENLQATMSNINNRVYYNKPTYATLEASATLMGKGFIQATFRLPIEDEALYQAKGKLSPMALYHLNPVLENLAFISIESGKLNGMTFNFEYSDLQSNGALTINYTNLKINALKKEKIKNESDLKSFIINAVVKNDKDKSVSMENRTGRIEFKRDRKKQIFNFWWKSLLSGIKTSVLNPDGNKKKVSPKKL